MGEHSGATGSRVTVQHRAKNLDVALVILSMLLLAALAVAALVAIPAMRTTFNEFDVLLPRATQLALSFKTLLGVEAIGAALIGFGGMALWRGKRSLGILLAALSLLTTFVASAFFVYAMSLPAAASVVVPETEQGSAD